MQKGLKKYFVNMDDYLSSLGLYRKMVARDASSLFRAVSEQMYFSQNYHQRIRQDCADFMRTNKCHFEPFVEGSFEKYLERLEDPKETVGQVEIKALSQLYRRSFHIYRYPGKPATVISEEDFVDKVMLCCSINGHYDIVYLKNYPASAAVCQALLYEVIYTQVFNVEEAELYQAMESARMGGRCYRNNVSISSEVDFSYDTPEDRGQREEAGSGGMVEDKLRAVVDDLKPSEAVLPTKLSLPYKVIKSLDPDVYRNLEFDVWQDTCKEMQKTDYMVFAGRQYFLGDKCQVRLEPKGKYYNAFIQEVGTHPSAVTVFIEELGEKHLVPLTDLKPVNPVPAWNVSAPPRKGELDSDPRQRNHRNRYFRKSRGNSGVKGVELLMPPPSSYGAPTSSPLPPRFQPTGHPRPPPPPSAGALAYDPYAPPHNHVPAARAPRYGASRSSTRFLNRHLIGPQLTYYHPGRRYLQDYENYAFRRSRRQLMAPLNKDCQFGFPPETGEDPPDLDTAIAYYQLDDTSNGVFPPLPGSAVPPPPTLVTPPPPPGSSYRVQRNSGTLPSIPPPGNTPVCSSEEEQEDTSTAEDQAEFTEDFIYSAQDQSVYTTPAESCKNQDEQEEETTESPHRQDLNYNYSQQVVKPLAAIGSSPSSSSSSPSSPSSHVPSAASAHTQTRSVAMAIPTTTPWLANELGEPVCSMMTPPPYSYDPNGNDLPRDCRVLQYYFNLGVQWCHHSCWQQQQQQQQQQQVYSSLSPDTPYTFQQYNPYMSQEMHAVSPPYAEASRNLHQPPPSSSTYPESSRPSDGQVDGHGSGTASSIDGSTPSAPTGSTPSVVYPEQTPLPPPSMLHLPYEASPMATYLPSAAHPVPLAHHSYHCLPPSTHWGVPQTGGHGARVYCPAPNPPHVVAYIAAPPPHHSATHYIPPTM
ncbi:putative bifunctional UDP-N-acetylglucosamine transferase and deubiquitinase ALG13 isoform X2 [Cynoglossus semilaevis]|uniref:putative bifunctional UDP-N-acetylglucosamine transferase and deubiquitinase ALG13 isoform X2 n=1 Tax=Cynoglossus semilaevis TaxID=244447 RepID=UPI0004970AAE|nr:putative bifunctional UDP-N-acetylglucosamine transferase and deubiquitinase ALG13 isoform X2 [Cynoglossus semilaevis]